jgi:dihydroneopterin aldolase
MALDPYTVFVKRLEVYAFHGVSDAEQTVGHRYLIDISIEVSGSAPLTDDIDQTVDYAEVATIATEVCRDRHYRTLERLASAIADSLLELPAAQALEITISKPLPPMAHIAGEAGITLRRKSANPSP